MIREGRSRTGAVILLALVAGVSIATATEIEPGIYRVDGIDETLPHDDLAPLEGIVGRAQIVGLGESVHTVGGYYQAKFRIFKYLVEELGFRAFGFESPWFDAERVADYVRDCRGTARNAIRGLFGVWQGVSVRDLVHWMCEWNQAHPEDPVHFYGFDIQQRGEPYRLRPLLVEFGMDPSDSRLSDMVYCTTGNTARTRHENCLAALDSIEKFLDRNEDEIVAATSEETLAGARIHMVVLRSFENLQWYFDIDWVRAYEARDEGMAYLAAAIREIRFPEARTALWAHNAHIAKGRMFGPRVMGGHLKKAFKRKYRVIGLVAHQASIDWRGVGCGLWSTASDESVEGLLRALGEPFLLVDLKFPGGKPPFLKPGRKYEINSIWNIAPKRRFDALFYLENAEKMRPLAWPSCTP